MASTIFKQTVEIAMTHVYHTGETDSNIEKKQNGISPIHI